jgi:hypothetical protein
VEWQTLLDFFPADGNLLLSGKKRCLVSAQQQPMRDDMHDHCSAPSDLAQNTDLSPTRCCGDIAEIIPVVASLGAQAKDNPSMVSPL